MAGSEVCHGEDPADCQSPSHTHHINAALFIGHESMLVGGWLVTTSLLDLREAFKKKEKIRLAPKSEKNNNENWFTI